MFLNYLMFGLLIIESVVVFYCCIKASKYDEYVNAINSNEYSGKNLFGIGFAFTELIKFDFSNQNVQKTRDQIVIIYGKKYCDFYLRVSYAQRFTYSIVLSFLSLAIGCLVCGTDGFMLVVIGILLTCVTYVYYSSVFAKKIEEMSIKYMSDFPNAISTIALLVNAGMFLRDAWREAAYSSDKPLYKQMQQVTEDMKNGMSEEDALYAFSRRCATPEIKKFISMIVQSIEKGGNELTASLSKQADLLWNEKKQSALQQGEKASNKLMIPIAIMFVGILLMIMMPVITNMSL